MAIRVYLRPPEASDSREFLAAARASRAFHRPWVSAPATPEEYHDYVSRMKQPDHRGFLVRERESDGLAGVINISNIVWRAFRSGYLGFYAFAGYERRGLMREGLAAAVRSGFQGLRLHRLEANIQPSNAASIALVKACGFSKEGLSPRYLKFGGRWKDHERWAIVAR